MRLIITGSSMTVLFMLLILIHISVVSTNIRDLEVSSGLKSGVDYAVDEMWDMYKTMDYDVAMEETYTVQLIECFCQSLEKMIGTDGEIEVSVVAVDFKSGSFDFVIREDYDYGFMGRKGSTVCERAVYFGEN